MYLETGRPMRGAMKSRLITFLNSCGLRYDEGVDFTCALMEDDEIIAAGSLDGATLKCIAVSPLRQGEDLTSHLITELCREAFARGHHHLMLFTKPANQMMFRQFGFHPVLRTQDCLLMENKKSGLEDYISTLGQPHWGLSAAIVGNFNPFTLGHRYLIETAAAQCDHLHVFVLSEEKSAFAPDVRMKLAQAACADIENISFHFTGPYMVSSATFPSYFIKDSSRVEEIYCELDVRIFAEKIAPALSISRRFLGTEPHCPVTRFYNEQLKSRLPGYGIEVVEIPRRQIGGEAVSASQVRALCAEGRLDEIRPLVPQATFEYLKNSQFRR